MKSLDPSNLPEPNFPEKSASLPAVSAPNAPARVDEAGEELIIFGAPAKLLGLDMADPRTISADVPTAESVVCPFCAHVRADAAGSCPKCTMEDTATTRRSTGERIGPWFVLQRRNPTAPGLRLSVLLTLARRGHVTPKSIVRGPTTGQFWRYAAQVKGLSRVFGLCWHCGAGVSPDAATCPRCKSAQEIPDDPDQFLESHAALPVMREVSTREEIEQDPSPRALPPARRELPEQAKPPGDLAVRDARPTSGTRSITLARGDDDVILSASELAAAFQLDLPQPGLVKRTSRRIWKLTKVAAILLVLISLASVAVIFFKPDWYRQARDTARPYWDRTQSWVARAMGKPVRKPSTLEDLSQLPPITPIQLEPRPTTSPSNPDAADGANKLAGDEAAPLTGPQPRVQSVWSQHAVDPNAPIDALAGQASVFQPTTRNVYSPPPVATASELDTILAKQDAPKSDQPSKSTKQPIDTSTPMSLDEAIAAAATLRTSALDAEARRDWPAAVMIYEQIAKLPEAAHPSDLKVKLAVARERARS